MLEHPPLILFQIVPSPFYQAVPILSNYSCQKSGNNLPLLGKGVPKKFLDIG
jgi:hypothetical protein